MAAARRRRRDEEARTREPGETGKEEAGERSVAGQAAHLQELLGNVSATEVMARSALQRQATETEAAPAKSGEDEKNATYAMTVSDVGTFDLVAWSWGTSDSGAGGGGGGPGKANFRDLSATKKGDKHTPELMLHASSGRHIKTVELRSQRGGESILITLKDVLVSSFRVNDGDPPTETFMLTFAELEYGYGEKAK